MQKKFLERGTRSLVLSSLMTFAALVVPVIAHANGSAASGKPGAYRLQSSNDENVCRAVEAVLNAPAKKRAAAKVGNTFANWRAAAGVERGNFDGPIVETHVDLDNDGSPDRVLKASFSIGGALTDVVHVASSQAGSSVSIRELLSSGNTISFVDPNRIMERLKQKHGADWQRWFFHGIATVEPLRYRKETYLLAQHVQKARDLSSKAYVFQLQPAGSIDDLCMFSRICPCGGCRDLRGEEFNKALPSPQWCEAR